MMTEEKCSDVIVAVWLAGCQSFLQRLIILPHSQTEPQPGDQHPVLKRIITDYSFQLDLSRTVPVPVLVQWSSSAKLIPLYS